ncbi:MAG: hypothetical protein ABSC23_15800 [Bryobacteraceae bacterium]|jgi:hypothetical protein
MDSSGPNRLRDAMDAALAGLQAGMVATVFFLAWMGVAARFAYTSFWTAENLMASVFHGRAAIRGGMYSGTISGLALYLLLYSLLGALFAMAVRGRVAGSRLTLAGILFGLCWYYLSFRMAAKAAAPLVALLHAEGPTLWGHALYGALLARYRLYLPRSETPAAPGQPAPEATPAAAGDGAAEPPA